MKVIDLLNKIANGEEVPKILHNNKYGIYEKEKRAVAFYNDEKCTSYFGSWFNWELCEDGLNDEIEIKEESKKIEKLKPINGSDLVNLQKNSTLIEQSEAVSKLIITLNENRNKLNEIIDYINKEE